MAAITVVIVVMTGLQTQDALIFGLSRVLEICIGIICAFAVSVLVFPKRKVDVLRAKLEAQANHCADSCRVLVDAFLSRQRNIEESLLTDLVKDVWENHALLQKIRQNESLIYHKKFKENFALKVSVISRSVEHLRNMARALIALDDNGYEIIMSQELKKVAEKSGRALVVFVKNEPLTVKDRRLGERGQQSDNADCQGLARECMTPSQRDGCSAIWMLTGRIPPFSFPSGSASSGAAACSGAVWGWPAEGY
ncbi:MAG: FUSC family protein [Deltaproteobacteria bacterium]|jgi:hypothetical protein|nr:FUSC family protein [Deltaproteobacteria bacterium]